MNKKHVLFLPIFFVTFLSFGQETILSSGNKSISSSGSVNYSVGLLHYKEGTGSGGNSSTGTQLPFEITQVLSIDEENLISLKLFPNPTANFLFINLQQLNNYNYTINDLNGKRVLKGNLHHLQNQISLKKIKPAVYFLSVKKEGKTIESYKIIKK